VSGLLVVQVSTVLNANPAFDASLSDWVILINEIQLISDSSARCVKRSGATMLAVHLLLYTKKTRSSAANQQVLIAASTTTLVTLFTIMHCVYHTTTGIEDGVLEIPTLDALEGATVEVYIEGWKPVRGVKPDLLSGEKQVHLCHTLECYVVHYNAVYSIHSVLCKYVM
jgi:hypothetical protein